MKDTPLAPAWQNGLAPGPLGGGVSASKLDRNVAKRRPEVARIQLRSAWQSAPVDLRAMLSRPAVALFALVAVEYVAITQLAGVIGGARTALVMVLFSLAGAMLFRRVGSSFLETSVATAMQNAGLANVPGAERFANADASADKTADRAMLLFGALLMIVPGIATGVLGALLFLPPVRALARPVVLHRIQPWIRPNLRFSRGTMGFGRDVVDVDVVDDTSDEPPASRAELR